MDIDQAIKSIIKSEGGFVNHPHDRGGPTKYGITLRTLENYRARRCTAADVEAMGKQEAYDIYYHKYYIRPEINKLPEALIPAVLDTAVNCGAAAAIKMLQDCLVTCGFDIGKIDGVCGAHTQRAAVDCWQAIGNDMLRKFVNRRIGYYEDIVKHNETQRAFLPGWIARAEKFLPTERLAA